MSKRERKCMLSDSKVTLKVKLGYIVIVIWKSFSSDIFLKSWRFMLILTPLNKNRYKNYVDCRWENELPFIKRNMFKLKDSDWLLPSR